MWKDQYAGSKRQPEDIIGLIRPGNRVYIETGCSEPRFLVERLILENRKLSDVEIYTTIPLSGYSDFGGKFGSRFRIKSFFISPSISSAFSEGNADHMPLSTAGLTNLIKKKYIRINVAIIQLGPPDDRGYMSLGVTVDITRTVIENADIVIAQVNARVPRTFGDGFIHVGRVHHIVEHDEPLIEFPAEEPDPETLRVGENIAGLIEDGATIQVGFGRIPDAALLSLRGKKDIGVHSEIITDSICDLVERGVITNDKKPIDRGKIVASMCLGTRRIFDFVHDNPSVELRRPTYTSNPQVFHAIDNLVAINGAVEIDLTGQSCVGMSMHRDYFGVLSHAEFNKAAMFTPHGRGIIALRSTSRDGDNSRIVPEFTDSRIGIITTQSDIQYVVTEFGRVDLFGKSIRDRALSLISIAHPKFRTWLLDEAKRLNYVYQDQCIPPEYAIYPDRYECVQNFGEERLAVRPIRVTDERGIQDLFYAMSQDDKFYRFLRHVSVLHHQQAQPLVCADYRNSMALVVTRSENMDGTILAVSHFARELKPGHEQECEFAVMVHPSWQNKGIGSFLFNSLLSIALDFGFSRMNAYVWEDNAQMMKIFEKTGRPFSKSLAEHVNTVQMDIAAQA